MFKNIKRISVITHDLIMSALAWQLAWWIRFNFDIPAAYLEISYLALPLVIIIQGLTSWRFYLYRGIWRFASIPDLWNIFRSALFGALCITLVLFIAIRLENVPRLTLILYPILLIFMLGGPRLGYRAWKDHSLKFNAISGKQRVLIIGAGSAGEMLVRDILRDNLYSPIGFVDDNKDLKERKKIKTKNINNL